MPKKIFTQELEGTRQRGRPRKGWREEVERDLQVLGVKRWKELVIDRGKMERYCSTGQSPQWAVAPTEEERRRKKLKIHAHIAFRFCIRVQAPSNTSNLSFFHSNIKFFSVT